MWLTSILLEGVNLALVAYVLRYLPIECNEDKTKCTCVKSSIMKDLYVGLPTFQPGHLNIKAVKNETYLGYIINTDMSDDDHRSKEIRNIYARGNMLIRNFKHCTTGVKITLFETYCSSSYCCPMWTKYLVVKVQLLVK